MLKQVAFCIIISLSFLFSSPDQGYGPFNMLLTAFDVCTGPKKESCTNLTAEIIGKNVVYVNNKVLKNCNVSKGKIVSSSNGKLLAKFLMQKPCEHLFLKPLLVLMYNISKSCTIMKGHYSAKVDIGQVGSKYFGASFFYGNITVKTYLYSDECNFSCINLRLAMTPK